MVAGAGNLGSVGSLIQTLNSTSPAKVVHDEFEKLNKFIDECMKKLADKTAKEKLEKRVIADKLKDIKLSLKSGDLDGALGKIQGLMKNLKDVVNPVQMNLIKGMVKKIEQGIQRMDKLQARLTDNGSSGVYA